MDEMVVDIKILENVRNQATLAQKKGVVLKSLMQNLEIPPDEQYGALDLSVTNSLAVSTEKNLEKLTEKIITVINNFNNLEKEFATMADNLNNTEVEHFHVGDKYSLSDGVKYYETALGEGDSGTVGNENRPAGDDYTVDRVAYFIDGKLVANINDTGTDVEECRMKYANEYGVDISQIDMRFHVSYGDGQATGWLDSEQVTYEQLNEKNQKEYEAKVAQLKSNGKDEITNVSYKNLELAFKEIDSKYNNDHRETIQNKIAEIKAGTHEEIEPVSFWATVGEGASNAGAGVMKSVTVPIDWVTKHTFIPDTHLTEGVNDMQDAATMFYGEHGSAGVSELEKSLQELSGAVLFDAVTGKYIDKALKGAKVAKAGKKAKKAEEMANTARKANNARLVEEAAKAGNKMDDIADVAKATAKMDDIADVAKATAKMDDIADVAKATAKMDDIADVAKATAKMDDIADVAKTTAEMDDIADVAKATAEMDDIADVAKATDKMDDIADVAKTTSEMDDIADVAKATDKMDDIVDGA